MYVNDCDRAITAIGQYLGAFDIETEIITIEFTSSDGADEAMKVLI